LVMTLSQLYSQTRRALMIQEDSQQAGLLARQLICHATGKSQEQVIADGQHYAGDHVCAVVLQAVDRLLKDEPLAYILEQWDFYGMRLYVNKHVLIPRDDTCCVTDLAIKQARLLEGTPRILDLCTGSGCIGLAIANHIKNAKLTLADISKDALAVARRNTKEQNLSSRVACVQANALEKPGAFLGEFDMIVSNPPYITSQEMEELDISVKDYEPRLALHGGADGLDFYRSIASNYRFALKSGGYLCLEFGMGQGDAVCAILEENGYTILERSRDYTDTERAVLARFHRKDEN